MHPFELKKHIYLGTLWDLDTLLSLQSLWSDNVYLAVAIIKKL